MDVYTYAKRYGISEELMEQLVAIGLFEDLLQEQEDIQVKDEIQRRLSASICLHSLGLTYSTIKEYLLMEEADRSSTRRKTAILREVRKETLERMHAFKRTLDAIDCMLSELNSIEKETRKSK